MTEKGISELSDHELLAEAKKVKSASIFQALAIGFLFGIVLYSLFANSYGFFTLIPLYFAYRLIQISNYDKKELDRLLKERNLK